MGGLFIASRLSPSVLIYALLGAVFSLSVQAETVIVTLEKDNALAIVDSIAGKLNKMVDVGLRPRGIALSPDNKYLYVAVSNDNTVKIIDAETYKTVGHFSWGGAKL